MTIAIFAGVFAVIVLAGWFLTQRNRGG